MPRVSRNGPEPGQTGIQTLIFLKPNWSRSSAQQWARDNDFFAGPVDETDTSFRIRQFNPDVCADGSVQTLTENFPAGVSAVECRAAARSSSQSRAQIVAEIVLYDVIGEAESSAKAVIAALQEADPTDEITVAINSVGGNIFDGEAIYNALKRHKGRVIARVDGLAASAASYIAMAASEIVMAPGAHMMLHSPLAFAGGNAGDLRDTIARLEAIEKQMVRVYAQKSGLDEGDVRKMLAEETWLTAEQAIQMGFADKIDEDVEMAAAIYGDMVQFRYRHVPAAIAAISRQQLPNGTIRLGQDEQDELRRKNIEAAEQQKKTAADPAGDGGTPSAPNPLFELKLRREAVQAARTRLQPTG